MEEGGKRRHTEEGEAGLRLPLPLTKTVQKRDDGRYVPYVVATTAKAPENSSSTNGRRKVFCFSFLSQKNALGVSPRCMFRAIKLRC